MLLSASQEIKLLLLVVGNSNKTIDTINPKKKRLFIEILVVTGYLMQESY